MIPPLANAVITQPFGCTGFPAETPLGSCAHFHRGIDLADGRCGMPVYAAAAGTVHRSAQLLDGNNYIWLAHAGGLFTLYGHLEVRKVATGDPVTQGQVIGLCGMTGEATGCHVHFAVKHNADPTVNLFADTNGEWLDPEPLIYGGDAVSVYESTAATGSFSVSAGSTCHAYKITAAGFVRTGASIDTGSGRYDAALKRISGAAVPSSLLHVATGLFASFYVDTAEIDAKADAPSQTYTKAQLDAAAQSGHDAGYAQAKAKAVTSAQAI